MTRAARLAGILVPGKVYMRSINKVVTQCAAALVVWALGAAAGAQERAQQASQQPAQQPTQQSDQQTPTIKAEVGLVNVFATVRDKKKQIIPTLKRKTSAFL